MGLSTKDAVVKPLHREGPKFIAIFAAATLVLFLAWAPLGVLGLILTGWCYQFFRDPVRITPQGEGLVISPADGLISLIEPAVPPAELGLGAAPLQRVSVFMSVFDVHVNRAPVPGTITTIAYRPGKFLNATLDKASDENERNGFVVETAEGARVGFVQIAGLLARRILCEAAEGQAVERGERVGLIRFGSRVDVYLPHGTAPRVAVGQKMVAGETVLAVLGEADAPAFRAA
jgi:phosphatidylserine decarboxylase